MTGKDAHFHRIGRVTLYLLIGVALAMAAAARPADATIEADAKGPGGGQFVYIIPVHGEINNLTANFIEWGLQQSQTPNRAAIVLDIDTPGGAVINAIDICRKLKALTNERVVAWVHPEAISAGSMISLACDEIVIADGGKIGDCAPILIGPQGLQSLGETERAKMNSYILAEFRDSAQMRHYPLPLAESMVALGPAVYRIVHPTTDQTKIVFADDLPNYGLNAEQPNTASSEGWKIDKRLVKEGTLLTMVGQEAIDYGFARAFVNNESQLLKYLNLPGAGVEVKRFEPDWSQSLFGWLSTPAIRGLLVMVVVLAIYFEFQSPGLGLGAIAGIVAGALLLGAPYLTGLASMSELLVILAGIILLAVEIFIIPGFGVVGVTGLILIFLGLLMTFVPTEPGPNYIPQLPGSWDDLRTGFITLFISFTVAIIAVLILMRYFGSLPLFRRLVLSGGLTEPPDDGPPVIGGSGASQLKVGDAGEALSDLRPAGRAKFGAASVDVVTDGAWVEAGSQVVIRTIAGNRVVVRKI